jgi:hypothetical protein
VIGRLRAPAAPGRRRLEERLDAVRGTCFCLLYDLTGWLAGGRRKVPIQVREYRLAHLRDLPDPRERMGRYVDATLLQAWEDALRPFFRGGAALLPQLGDTAPLWVEGLDGKGQVRAEVRFTNRSSVVDLRDRRHSLSEQEWRLEVALSPELDHVEDARLRPA